MTSPDGVEVSAVYGVLSTITKALKHMGSINLAPTHLLVAFDPKSCWRHEEYAAYKDGRSETDSNLRVQLDNFVETLQGVGISATLVERFEADDVLASAAAQFSQAGGGVAILSGDRDLLQMVGPKTLVLAPQNGGQFAVMNRAAVTEKYNIPSDRYIDLAALKGDKSDNLPGVVGVGPVKAEKLIAAFGGALEALATAKSDPASVDAAAGNGTAKKLLASEENLERNMRLMKLSADLPVDVDAMVPKPELTADGLAALGINRIAEDLCAALATMTVVRVFSSAA